MNRTLLLLVALSVMPLTARAYFDPGAGAVLLQVLIAAGIGIAYKLRNWFAAVARKLSSLFRR